MKLRETFKNNDAIDKNVVKISFSLQEYISIWKQDNSFNRKVYILSPLNLSKFCLKQILNIDYFKKYTRRKK